MEPSDCDAKLTFVKKRKKKMEGEFQRKNFRQSHSPGLSIRGVPHPAKLPCPGTLAVLSHWL